MTKRVLKEILKPKGKTNAAVSVILRDEGDHMAAAARTLTRPEVGAAAAIEHWQTDTHDVNELACELSRQVAAVNDGDMRRAEAMLIAQAHVLDNIFVNLARRAKNQEHLLQFQTHLNLAFKAQSQCRATLAALGELKNGPVVFTKQTNINNGGQQQVVNGQPMRPLAPARQTEMTPNELSGGTHELCQDSRAPQATIRAHSYLEPVGAVNRADEP
jgi:hypothetical protein